MIEPEQAPSGHGSFFKAPDGRLRAIWRAMLYVLLGGGLTLASQVGLGLLLRAIAPEVMQQLQRDKIPPPAFGIPTYALLIAAALLAAWIMLAAFDRRGFRTLGIWFYRGWLRELLLGTAMGGGLIAIVAGVLVVAGLVRFVPADGGLAFGKFFALTGFILLAAAWEEIVFRGYPFQRLVESVGPLGAILVLAILFGAAHIPNPASTLLSTANTVLAGVLLAAAYLKTRALWLPIGLHFAWNWVMGLVLGLPVSGLNFAPSLLAAESSGPRWLSGGDYGPEGSIVLTVAAIAATTWLWRSRKIRPSPAMGKVLQ